MAKQVSMHYQPRHGFDKFHNRDKRYAILLAHRRRGKTVACINEVHTRAVYSQKKRARYAYIAPTQSQAKDVAWEYLLDATQDSRVKVMESELYVTLFNGSRIKLYSSENQERMRGLYFDGVVIDEYGDCRPSLWGTIVRPCLADRNGWAAFIGTPKGPNHFYKLIERAKASKLWYYDEMHYTDEHCPLSPEEIEEMKLDLAPHEWEQEMELNFFAPVPGLYYADDILTMESGRLNASTGNQPQIDNYPWQPHLPVHVAADLGHSDSTAFWFWQETPTGPWIIDYFENQGQKVPYYIDLLKGVKRRDSKRYDAKEESLRQRCFRYKLGKIYLPHDARQETVNARATYSQMRDEMRGIARIVIVPKLGIQDGINAVRYMLPLCNIDKERCAEGIEALRGYRRKHDEVNNRFLDEPLHNWASNGADAFRYFSLMAKESVSNVSVKDLVRSEVEKSRILTLDDLWTEREFNNVNWNAERL